jgi:hypothetical protein
MTKKLREGMRLYIAPKIRGELVQGIPKIFDELNKGSLDANNVADKIIIYKR